VAAFIAEPVMGAGGVIVPPRGYFDKIQKILKKYDVLFIVDEVICGFGRTGNMFGIETFDLKPDIITLAKAMSSGYQPISATVISEDIYQALEVGARAYIIKGMPHEALADALRRVYAGGRFIPSPVSRALAARMPDSDLSSREREVLQLLAHGESNKRIAAHLGITEATVKSHVSAILMRLQVEDRTQAVVTALQRGIVHLQKETQ